MNADEHGFCELNAGWESVYSNALSIERIPGFGVA
jgi:hypothetical protein